jgi:hypothetical protein
VAAVSRRRVGLAVACAVLVVAGAAALWMWGTGRSVDVTVRVEGANCSRKPAVVVEGGGGGELEVFERLEPELPWEARFELHAGDDVTVAANGDSGCTLTCVVAVGGIEQMRREDTGDVECEARIE